MEFSFNTDFLQQVILLFMGVFATGVMGLIAYYVRRYFNARADCFRQMQEQLQEQDKRGIRQSRAIILLSQKLDLDTKRLHPDEPENGFTIEIEKLLQDENGKL